MLLQEKFKDTQIILGSKSPRRHELLKRLTLNFEIQTKNTDESYPEKLQHKEIPEFIVKAKSDAFGALNENQLLITADTVVWFEGESLGKPVDAKNAKEILQKLSGNKHEVITSVGLRSQNKSTIFSEVTTVYFKELQSKEIDFYLEHQPPLDKAGAYGIQDWIGAIAIEKIDGCFFNVMGLPTSRLYEELINLKKVPVIGTFS